VSVAALLGLPVLAVGIQRRPLFLQRRRLGPLPKATQRHQRVVGLGERQAPQALDGDVCHDARGVNVDPLAVN